MASIPAAFQDLFEKPTVGHFATLTATGGPHVTPVWVDYEADRNRVVVNTERGRRKERNVRADPRVGLSMTDPEDPYRRLSVHGTVETVTTEGARAHIDRLAARYMGRETYPGPIETERVRLLVAPDEVIAESG